MTVSETEATIENILPLLVTDVMHKIEAEGKHPEADFTERLRAALRKIVPEHPYIEQDLWDPQKKEVILEGICDVLEL